MKKRILVSLSALVLSIGVLAGCNNNTTAAADSKEETGATTDASSSETSTDSTAEVSTDSSEKIVLRLGDQTPSYALYFTYAKEKGFFDEVFANDNVEVVVNDFASGPVLNESFGAGEVDFGVLGTLPIISGKNNGYKYHIVGKLNSSEKTVPLITTDASGIKSLEDLKGKKVATAIGGQYHYLALKYLEKAGLTVDDVEIINATTDIPVLLANGDIDVATYGLLGAYDLESQGIAHILSDEPGDVITGYIVGTDEFVEKYPEITDKFIEAMKKTLKLIDDNPSEYAAFLAEKTGKSQELVEKYLLVNERNIEISDGDIKSIQGVIDFVVSQGIIAEGALKPEDLVNERYR